MILVATAAVALPQGMQMPMTKTAGPQSDAQKAFEKLKTLTGSWQGSVMGMSVQTTIRVTSTGNAILHETTSSSRPDDPITMIYLDGDHLLLTHYCDTGNRPRMEGKLSPDGKSVEFSFLDNAGSTERGLMNHVLFTLIDANHHSEEWTYMLPANKSGRVGAELQRTK